MSAVTRKTKNCISNNINTMSIITCKTKNYILKNTTDRKLIVDLICKKHIECLAKHVLNKFHIVHIFHANDIRPKT